MIFLNLCFSLHTVTFPRLLRLIRLFLIYEFACTTAWFLLFIRFFWLFNEFSIFDVFLHNKCWVALARTEKESPKLFLSWSSVTEKLSKILAATSLVIGGSTTCIFGRVVSWEQGLLEGLIETTLRFSRRISINGPTSQSTLTLFSVSFFLNSFNFSKLFRLFFQLI